MTATATIIDAESFPHLIDLIFDYAPLQSLLALRVNKAWKKRAESLFAYHVRFIQPHTPEEFPLSTAYHLSCPDPALSVDSALTGVYQLKRPIWQLAGVLWSSSVALTSLPVVPTFLSSTSVVDLGVEAFKYELRRILEDCHPDVTYRFLRTVRVWEHDVVQCRCLVLFTVDWDFGGPPDIEYIASYGLRALKCEKLVIHVWLPGTGSLLSQHRNDLRRVDHLTIVVTPWIMEFDVEDPPTVETVMRKHLGLLVGLVLMAWASGVPVTVVGFDFSDLEAEHPELSDLERHLKRWLIQERLADPEENFHFLALHHDAQGAQEIMQARALRAFPGFRFLNREEYRAEVGEAQYEIETHDGPLPRPYLRHIW